MAVIRAQNFRQTNPLVDELERQAQIAALRGQGVTANTIAQEAYGGNFPIGNLASGYLNSLAQIVNTNRAKNTKLREIETSNLVSEALNKGTVGSVEDKISGNIPVQADAAGNFYTTRVDPDLPMLKSQASTIEEAEAINKTSPTAGFGLEALTASILKDEGKTPETITIGKEKRNLIDRLKGELPAEKASNIRELANIGNLDQQTIELQRRLNLPKQTLVNGYLNGRPASLIAEVDPRTNKTSFLTLNGKPVPDSVAANFSTKKGGIPSREEYILDKADKFMQEGETSTAAAIKKATAVYDATQGNMVQNNIPAANNNIITDPIEAELTELDRDFSDVLYNGNNNANTSNAAITSNNIQNSNNKQSGNNFYETGSKQEADVNKKVAETDKTIVDTDKSVKQTDKIIKETEKLGLDIEKINFNKLKDKQAFRTQIQNTIDLLDNSLASVETIQKYAMKYGKLKYKYSKELQNTEAYKLQQAINDLEAQLMLKKLTQMKSETQTGASGLGQLNMKEAEALTKSYGTLDFFRPVQALKTVKRIKEQTQRSIDNYKKYYKALYDEDYVN